MQTKTQPKTADASQNRVAYSAAFNAPTRIDYGQEITRVEARKLSRAAGQHSEPYRGYGHDLKDGRFVCCAPDGNFYVRSIN